MRQKEKDLSMHRLKESRDQSKTDIQLTSTKP